jgi:hypothetical protein
MKRKLVATILGIAAAAAVFNAGGVATAQGLIFLDNYYSAPVGGPYPLITYGAGSGGAIGTAVTSGFTVGLYLSSSAFTFEGGATSATGENSILNLPGAQAGGANSTATLGALGAGYYSATSFYATSVAAGQSVYAMVLAYDGATYDTSGVRGHSAVFQLTTSSAPPVPGFGSLPASFAVAAAVPEPSTFALAGLGLASLLIFRRRK